MPEGGLEKRVGAHVMQLGEDVLVAVSGGERLQVIQRRSLLIRGAAVAPFAPVAGHVAGLREHVAHGEVGGANGFLGVVGIVAIGESVALVKAGLLGGAGGRTDGAAVGAVEVKALGREAIERRRVEGGEALGAARGLSVGANGAPAHVVHIEVENIGSEGGCGFRADEGGGEKRADEGIEERFQKKQGSEDLEREG